jgi:hypothetical protein
MWKLFHLFVRVATTSPIFDPWPSSNVSYRILSTALSSKIFFRLARVFSRQLEFENAEYSVRFFSESINRDWLEMIISVFLTRFQVREGKMHWQKLTGAVFLRAFEKAEVSLIWSTAAMPEKQPLHNLALLEFV